MRLFLSRTVANKLTRLTCVLMVWPCAGGSCGMAGTASMQATIVAAHCVTSFFIEPMYTFLDEKCPAEISAGVLPPFKMR